MSLTHPQLKDLANLLSTHFNVKEFDDLTFAYGIDPANLGVTGPSALARELALYANRHVEIPKLLAAIHESKPQLDLSPFGGPPPDKAAPTPPVSTAPVVQQDSSSNQPEYVNFDIRVGEKRESDGRYPTTARSDQGFGETDSTSWQPLPDDDAFQNTVDFLRERMAQPAEAEQFGQRLREFLFPTKVLNLYNLSLAKVQADRKKGLRIRLRIDQNAPELSKIPWEYCFDDKGYLALNEETPFVRYIETTEQLSPIATPEKVRILVVIASPADQPALNVFQEEKWINEALANLQQAGKVEVKVLHHTTRRDLRRHVQRYDPHIFHFIGHGEIVNGNEGALVLEDGSGNTSLVSAKDMHMLLRNSEIKLAILSACQTAAHGTGAAIMGVAPRLIWAGIPASIAMQFKIPDKTAIGFTRDLYESLADGVPLDTAVTEARLGAYFDNDDKIHWAIPVLFMRSPDGVIWQ